MDTNTQEQPQEPDTQEEPVTDNEDIPFFLKHQAA